ELGHACTAAMFRKRPHIELVAFGGFTIYDVKNLSLFKQFLIVLNGPIFGFFLYLFADFLSYVPALIQSGTQPFFINLARVNLFWTVLNLFPILPLDGGQLLRIVLEGVFDYKGTRYAQIIGMLLGFLVSVALIVF